MSALRMVWPIVLGIALAIVGINLVGLVVDALAKAGIA